MLIRFLSNNLGFRPQYRPIPNGDSTWDNQTTRKSSWSRRTEYPIVPYLSHGLLLLSTLVFFLLWVGTSACENECIRPRLIFSPAKKDAALSYEKRRLWRDIENNKYTGEPRRELDLAWRQLIEPLVIKISKQEADMLGDDTIPLADGSGFIAELAVYHELHCIKRIRRHFDLDRYYPNMSAMERAKEETHVDHCLEYWREAAMCRGDTALATFQWVDGIPFSRVYSDHECVNWDTFDSWARGRMVVLSDYSQLSSEKI